ncbi:GNAT family N-acetyltransferase [Thalassotalea profundi]|uniref:N-acetyltransferase n=1 Tax=Thalassotalea profundi TaxID=2036687 RepID=A0ABQ3IRU7_9GAMM|nr:GNAT family N-acetyltransferase [Thalassotalea profundi]GHE89089.1 N-acetyltransferase [Thalassotalea profundi]
MDVFIENSQPALEEFITLRSKVGWGETPKKLAQIALENSLFHVVARDKNRLVGMARIVGDGALFFYIQDLVVDPDYQCNGIGNLLMQNIESYISNAALKGATIGLLSALGKEAFYSRFGYIKRSGSALGLGMCKFI